MSFVRLDRQDLIVLVLSLKHLKGTLYRQVVGMLKKILRVEHSIGVHSLHVQIPQDGIQVGRVNIKLEHQVGTDPLFDESEIGDTFRNGRGKIVSKPIIRKVVSVIYPLLYFLDT